MDENYCKYFFNTEIFIEPQICLDNETPIDTESNEKKIEKINFEKINNKCILP